MSATFSPEEIIQAKQFRILSQKALQEELSEHEKLGVFFPNSGVSAVMMTYERYKAMAERLGKLEEEIENLQLIKEFGDRFDASPERFAEKPEGMSFGDFYARFTKDHAK